MNRPLLKPCPFCGGRAYVRPAIGLPGQYEAGCGETANLDPDQCPAQPVTMPFVSAQAAAEAWNTRQPPRRPRP